jgi:hypothetical protein
MHCVTLLQKVMYTVRQYIALLFYIILWSEQKCIAGNIIKNSTVYCLKIVCSCFVMILKFYIFSAVKHISGRWGVVMVWWVATWPMSCFIVHKITARRVPLSYAGYLRTLQPLVALWCYVSTEFPHCTSSNLWFLRSEQRKYSSVGLENVVMWSVIGSVVVMLAGVWG